MTDLVEIRERAEYVRSLIGPMDQQGGYLDELSADVVQLLDELDKERAALMAICNEIAEGNLDSTRRIHRALLGVLGDTTPV